MRMKSRITKLENKARGRDQKIIFINAKNSEDFHAQIRALIEGGLDHEGKKFVYAEDPLRAFIESIKGASGPLVNDPARHFNKDKGVEAGRSNNHVPNESDDVRSRPSDSEEHDKP
jgi:hypothetical protein